AAEALSVWGGLVCGDGGGGVRGAEAVLGDPGPEPPHESSRPVGNASPVGTAQRAQQQHRQAADRRLKYPLGVVFEPPSEVSERALHRMQGHQKVTTIFPNTCRLSRRESPRSKSGKGTSQSMTGSMPAAILARLSRILRSEAPNEPIIRYCCWNSCIRVSVAAGPEVAPQVTSLPPRLRHRSDPLKVSAPTCSKTTSTPFFPVILRTRPSKRSVR